jgi:hypothetical protein
MRLKMYTSAMSSEFLRILMKRENEMMLYDAARGWKNHFVISLETTGSRFESCPVHHFFD